MLFCGVSAGRDPVKHVRVSALDPATDRFRRDLASTLGRPPESHERIALAVSGGPDSMVMLALAAAAFPGRVVAATVDHGFRAEAAEEAAMVATWCATLDVPHRTLSPPAPITGSSIQMRAREARYLQLARWAVDARAYILLTAHHADDQAETFLMRAARGSGVAGLAGIRARQELPLAWPTDPGLSTGAPAGGEASYILLRPLLAWRRHELRSIAIERAIPFVDEPSNADERHDRTRFRRFLSSQTLLPPEALADSARHAGEAEEALATMTRLFWDERRTKAGPGITIDMSGLPREIRRRLARRAIHAVRLESGIDQPGFTDSTNIESLLDALDLGRSATQGRVMASAKAAIWHFREAPPRRLH